MQNRNYLNNNNMRKGIALATCMAIVMGLFTGCGKKNDLQIAASPDEVQKGRYVETELSLPEEWKDKNISQIFRSGDELHFLVAGGSEGQTTLEEWKLGEGDTLTEVTKDWLKALPEGKNLESSDSFTLLQDAEGNQCVRQLLPGRGELFRTSVEGSGRQCAGYYTPEVAGAYRYGWLSVL